jgi:hypothetical protein
MLREAEYRGWTSEELRKAVQEQQRHAN